MQLAEFPLTPLAEGIPPLSFNETPPELELREVPEPSFNLKNSKRSVSKEEVSTVANPQVRSILESQQYQSASQKQVAIPENGSQDPQN